MEHRLKLIHQTKEGYTPGHQPGVPSETQAIAPRLSIASSFKAMFMGVINRQWGFDSLSALQRSTQCADGLMVKLRFQYKAWLRFLRKAYHHMDTTPGAG